MKKMGNAPFMGFDKEPPPLNSKGAGGRGPQFHSHSIMPRRKFSISKRHGRKR